MLSSLHRSARTTQGLLLLVVPHGGQHQARRNAWAAMSADSARARHRREAEAALTAAAAATAAPAAHAR